MLPNTPGGLAVRPGLTALVSGGAAFHSIARLNDPEVASFTYLWGVGTDVAMAAALTNLQALSGRKIKLTVEISVDGVLEEAEDA